MAAANSPIRVGLIGLNRMGAYHLERIRLRGDLVVTDACPAGRAESAETPHVASGGQCSSVDELLSRDDLDFVLIAARQAAQFDLAVMALQADKNVAIEPPLGASAGQAEELLAIARRTGRKLCVLPSRRDGIEFHAAQTVVQSAVLGNIYSARLVSWGRAVPGDDEGAGGLDLPRQDRADRALSFFAFQYVDQVFQLFRRPPRSVFARISPLLTNDPEAIAFMFSIAFDDGVDALIDVDLQSGALFNSGWMLAGAKGGYCGKRVYVADPSGEICDAPVSLADLPTFDAYAELINPPRDDEPFSSARNALSVMRLIDAARRSSACGEAVPLSES